MPHKLTDAQKEEDRRTRIQHPHMIKSKAHWDWESGYGNMEVPITTIPKKNHTTKIVVTLTIVIMLTVFLSTL
jgi:hypothetical protein